MLLTGVRTGELRSAVPEQFDLERGLWIIPPYIVPLSRQAVVIVRQLLEARRPRQHYLLPYRDDIKQRTSEDTLNSALRRMGYESQLTGHGIRATLSAVLSELGYRKEWIEVQLSLADSNQIRAACNHAACVEQRRAMMQAWADRLDRWEAGSVM